MLLSGGEVIAYDELVLATGAAPFVPPVPGHDLDGCFVYRTIEDLEAIREAASTATVGAVIGGGLLGLEAANALVPAGPGDPRRRDGAPPDGGAGRRGRRRDPDPAHREARPHGAHRCGDRAGARREPGDRPGPQGRRPDPRRGGGLLGRHPAARRAGPRRRARPRRARRGARRRALPHLRPARLGDRRVRRAGRPDVRPGRPRLRDGRGRGRRAARRTGRVPRRRHVHQAQADGRRRRQLRRRPRGHRGRARAGLRRRRHRGLQEAGHQRGRQAAARRHPGRRRVGVRRAPPDGRPPASSCPRTPRR